jgi:hypothetical protein
MLDVPVREAVSLAVMVWFPVVVKVTEKVPEPPEMVPLAGCTAWPLELVK